MANYTVSIFSQSRQSWRTIQVDTLADCVRLTLGLQTEFIVQCLKSRLIVTSKDEFTLPQNKPFQRQYAHALRSLVAQWKRRDYSPVTWFRMDDSQLWLHVSGYRSTMYRSIVKDFNNGFE